MVQVLDSPWETDSAMGSVNKSGTVSVVALVVLVRV